jgi:hypothetical protein
MTSPHAYISTITRAANHVIKEMRHEANLKIKKVVAGYDCRFFSAITQPR